MHFQYSAPFDSGVYLKQALCLIRFSMFSFFFFNYCSYFFNRILCIKMTTGCFILTSRFLLSTASVAIIVVMQLPPRLSLKTDVNNEFLYGMWERFFSDNAIITWGEQSKRRICKTRHRVVVTCFDIKILKCSWEQ